MNYNRVLVLAPHTDDGEIGCGGFIHKLIQQGSEVYYVAYSIAEASVPDGFPKDVLKTEVVRATNHLGVDVENLMIRKYGVRFFNYYRQDILEEMVALRKNIEPDLVLCPSSTDIHQDHKTVHEEAVRAFKFTTILGYEIPWNHLFVKQQMYVILDEGDVNAKVKAIGEYKSQMAKIDFDLGNLVYSQAEVRGMQIKQRYAECYEAIRMIL